MDDFIEPRNDDVYTLEVIFYGMIHVKEPILILPKGIVLRFPTALTIKGEIDYKTLLSSNTHIAQTKWRACVSEAHEPTYFEYVDSKPVTNFVYYEEDDNGNTHALPINK